MKLNEIRNIFLKFFSENYDHLEVKSSPLIPHNDPTLLFTNSGMVQFKNCFTHLEIPQSKRITTAQKCLRAGGKHNDLENVGYTTRHHTFFEMLGNFSFGDYFKDLAIEMAWKFITEYLLIPKNKLYITIYYDDDEAQNIWKKITGFDSSRIIKIKTLDNFWSMGDSGPCGPCSEIFYDHGEKYYGGLPGTPDQDGSRFVEIWNLVFMEYEQLQNSDRISLPDKSIDTGMGLERIAAVIQGVNDNYDIDIFKNIINTSRELSGDINIKENISSHKVIADHVRAACFMIADGIIPSNEGRGYVLRRILRRAIRHVHYTKSSDLLLYRLVDIVVQEMSSHYHELTLSKSSIEAILYDEEDKFREVLARGLNILEKQLDQIDSNSKLFSGIEAFKLYDTFGFPVDMIDDILKNHSMKVDMIKFNQEMEKQKQRSRISWKGSGENKHLDIWLNIANIYGKTEFIGYNNIKSKSKILSIVDYFTNNQIEKIDAGCECWIVIDTTPFYAESGGQVGDRGTFSFLMDDEHIYTTEVIDTQKYGDIFAHRIITPISLSINIFLIAEINQSLRNKIAANHSAAHLLHYALKKILGNHIFQKGSLVNDQKLRFDFSHNKSLTTDEIYSIEELVNQIIIDNNPVLIENTSYQDAIRNNVTALFGEKYGDIVRTVKMSESAELCGGTHVKNTGNIGLFRIIKQESIASGTRRIEALTGIKALEYSQKHHKIISLIGHTFQSNEDGIYDKINKIVDENKAQKNKIKNLKLENLINQAKIVNINEINQNITIQILIYNDKIDIEDIKELAKKSIDDICIIFCDNLSKNTDKNIKNDIYIKITNKILQKYPILSAKLISQKIIDNYSGIGGGNNQIAQIKNSLLNDKECVLFIENYIKNNF
ncbi:alanine--tRNA ligase [Lyticum sinuosum]|uniref:Alanine--tRNA ligase n=1 Tax=Lyticum sinuosum TaxID=1332059 RepID=A0AAE4VLZ4_9RICK|nr:alanine--tRNA ligase [Lyticum sinuosum]MDZ5760989.1 Alanine--tRNA ligase [Lyticum sinuosum]